MKMRRQEAFLANLNLRRCLATIMASAAIAAPGYAVGVDYEWDGGAGDNLWDSVITMPGVDTNWDSNDFPRSADNIILTGSSLAGPITIDLNGPQDVNRVEVDGVDGTYTFDNTGAGVLNIHLAGGNALLNNSSLSELVIDADVAFQHSTTLRLNSFAAGKDAGRIIVNGNVTTAAVAGTTTLELTSNNSTIGEVIQINGVISDGPTANIAVNAGFGGDADQHRGQVVLSGANTFTGPVDVNGATLTFNSIENVGGAANALGQPLLADSVINLGINAGGGNAPGTLHYNGTGHSSDRVLNLAGTTQGATIIAAGTGPLTLSGGITANTTNKGLTLRGNNTDANTISGIIEDASGAGVLNITKHDAGTWHLTADNTYLGSTTVNDGELILTGSIAKSSTASGVFVNNGGTFTFDGDTISATQMDVNAGGNFNFDSGTIELSGSTSSFNAANGVVTIGTDGVGTLNIQGTAAQFNGGLVIDGIGDIVHMTSGSLTAPSIDNSNGGTLSLISGSVTINGGQITTNGSIFNAPVNGTGGVTVVGAGSQLNMFATNGYTGPTNINEGRLVINGAGDQLDALTTVTIAAGAILDLQISGGGEGFGALAGEGSVLTTAGNGVGVGTNNLNTTFSGVISGGGNFDKNGSGTLNLTGNNTYGGETNINAGTLKLGAGNTLPDLTRVTLGSGATLDLDNADEEIGGLSRPSGATATVNLGTATLTVGGNNETLNFYGNITGSGGLTKVGLGNLRLRATNAFTGPVDIDEGTLTIGIGNTLGNNPVTVAAGATLNVEDPEGFGSLAGAGTVISVDNASVGVNPGHSNTDTTFSGNITGAGPFVKSGTGTMTMTGFSDYNGNTAVDAGELNFDGGSAGLNNTNIITLNGGDVTISNEASVTADSELRLDTTTSNLRVETGGSITSTSHARIGNLAGSIGEVTVTGLGSTLDTLGTSRIQVGNNGQGFLNVLNGGRVATQLLANADTGAGSADSATVIDGFISNGPNTIFGDDDDEVSLVTTRANVYVGDAARAFLTIQNGGRLNSADGSLNHGTSVALIGAGAAADGSIATVTGDKSRWVHNAHLLIARDGGSDANPAELRVLDSGYAEFSFLHASSVDGSRSKVTVDGPGSILKIRDARADVGAVSPGFGDIRMVSGSSNGRAFLDVTGGGTVNVDTNVEIGRTSDFGGQAHVTVDGVGSTINSGKELTVAYTRATASLTITDGGTVNTGTSDAADTFSQSAFVSRDSGNGTAMVGAPSGGDAGHSQATWNIGEDLFVSGDGSGSSAGFGTLNINPTGKVNVTNQLVLWAQGTVNLDGGHLMLDSIAFNNVEDIEPTFNFNSGTLTYTTSPEKTHDASELERILGTAPTLTVGKHLATINHEVLNAPLRLNGGTFSVGSIDPASIANLDFDAGTFNLTGSDLDVSPSGQFGATLIITDDQTINVSQNATVDPIANVIIAGGFSSNLLTNNGDLTAIDTTIHGAVHSPAGSTVTVIDTVTFTGPFSGGAQFFGPGTALFDATHSPGDSPALVNFEGSLAYGPSATLNIEIQSPSATTPVPGDDYDQLTITDDLSLNGTLNVISFPDPESVDDTEFGTEYEILSYGSRSDGTLFHTISGTLLNTGFALAPLFMDTDEVPDGDDDVLILRATVPGDLNFDNKVSVADLSEFALNFNTNPGLYNEVTNENSWQLGDFNSDGSITVSDLSLLALNFGLDVSDPTSPVPALGLTVLDAARIAGIDPASIPEPTTGLAVMAGLLGWIGSARKRDRSTL